MVGWEVLPSAQPHRTLKIEIKGLGVIGTNQTGVQSRGFHLHSTIAVTAEGLLLGILHSTMYRF
jgi:hypothetical protein